MTKLTYTDGYEVDYDYDLLGRVTKARRGTTTLASLTYDKRGGRVRRALHDLARA